MPDDLAREVIAERERGEADRGTTLSHWQQIANYLYPDRADFLIERTPGQKRMQYVFDATPLFALEQFAAGMHARLTSNTLPWFALVPDFERLRRIEAVRAWFNFASYHLYSLFNSPRLNFATQSHENYLDQGAFGTAVMAVLDGTSGPLFSTRHLKECVFAENDEDRIDQLSRKWQWTAKQAVAQWGAAAGEKPNKAVTTGKDQEKFWFHHRVRPRMKRDRQRADARHKPFESVYVSEADMIVIGEGGFDEFPYLASRFSKIPQEVDGRGPGSWMLPDIKMLNELMKIVVKGAEKVIDPPLMLPDDGFIVPIKTSPGSLNYYRAGTRPADRIAPITTNGNIPLGLDLIAALRSNIKEGFYLNLMLTPTDPRDPASAGKGVTATFTAKQQSENTLMLSPVLARQASENTGPLIERVFAMEWRKSVALRFGPDSPFPPPPDELRGAKWHVEYMSPIALAQRATELSAVDQVVQRQVQFRQMDPTAPMIVDTEAVIRLEARDLNAPSEILKSPERLRAEAAIAAKMAQQQHDAQIAQQNSGAVANLAGAQQQLTQQAAA
jgi:hypothetical protein